MKDRKELFELKEELLVAIADVEEIKEYVLIEDKMKQNEKIMNFIKEKKEVQQQLVNIKAMNKPGQQEILEERMTFIENTLSDIPLYQQYLYAIEDAQEVLDEIAELIQIELSIEEIQ